MFVDVKSAKPIIVLSCVLMSGMLQPIEGNTSQQLAGCRRNLCQCRHCPGQAFLLIQLL